MEQNFEKALSDRNIDKSDISNYLKSTTCFYINIVLAIFEIVIMAISFSLFTKAGIDVSLSKFIMVFMIVFIIVEVIKRASLKLFSNEVFGGTVKSMARRYNSGDNTVLNVLDKVQKHKMKKEKNK